MLIVASWRHNGRLVSYLITKLDTGHKVPVSQPLIFHNLCGLGAQICALTWEEMGGFTKVWGTGDN